LKENVISLTLGEYFYFRYKHETLLNHIYPSGEEEKELPEYMKNYFKKLNERDPDKKIKYDDFIDDFMEWGDSKKSM